MQSKNRRKSILFISYTVFAEHIQPLFSPHKMKTCSWKFWYFFTFKFPHLLSVSHIELAVLKWKPIFTSVSVLISLCHNQRSWMLWNRFSSTVWIHILSCILTSLLLPTTDATTTKFSMRTGESGLCFICLISKLMACCHAMCLLSEVASLWPVIHIWYLCYLF